MKDNGIGIPEIYLPKIFDMFGGLHSKKSYSGTGIGLAHCKKIVENNGGEIWANSTENGVTISFKWPKKK